MAELIPTRATLLQRLKNWQDQSSWQAFFDTYWELIFNIARQGGLTEDEAQEVVQETMISVAKRMPSFNYDPAVGSFKTWLLNMTRWRIVAQLRKRVPLAANRLASDCTATGTNAADKIVDPASRDLNVLWDAEWEKNLFDAAMVKVRRRVDPQKYQIFDLYIHKGWAPGKVAKAFGIPVAQVYLAKHRVTEMIKEEVRRLEVEIT